MSQTLTATCRVLGKAATPSLSPSPSPNQMLVPGARLASLQPHLRALALLALGGWLANIIAAVLFASARWNASMAGRVKLMDS